MLKYKVTSVFLNETSKEPESDESVPWSFTEI